MSSVDLSDIQVDGNNLYREEMVTDMKVATIRQLIPIKLDGTVDTTRDVLFSAQTHVMSQMGPLPITSPLEASTLEEAIKEFPEAIKRGVERMVEEAREVQRQESGRIVVPRPGAVPPGGLGGAPGQGPSSIIT